MARRSVPPYTTRRRPDLTSSQARWKPRSIFGASERLISIAQDARGPGSSSSRSISASAARAYAPQFRGGGAVRRVVTDRSGIVTAGCGIVPAWPASWPRAAAARAPRYTDPYASDFIDCTAITDCTLTPARNRSTAVASITIRNLDDDIKQRLRVRAAGHG
ncbi:MAG: FitA-like ribbon-helix-helix domain-containing protein, partial [Pseudomonadota bacterium]